MNTAIISGNLGNDPEMFYTKYGENRSNIKIIAYNIEFMKTDGRGFENGNSGEDDSF